MEVLGIALGTFLLFMVISILVATFFMWAGAKMAGLPKSKTNFGNSLMAAIGAAVVTWIISAIFAGVAGIGAIIGFLIGVVLSIFVIKAVFKIDWGKSFLVWLFHLVAQILVFFIAAMTFAGALLTLVK